MMPNGCAHTTPVGVPASAPSLWRGTGNTLRVPVNRPEGGGSQSSHQRQGDWGPLLVPLLRPHEHQSGAPIYHRGHTRRVPLRLQQSTRGGPHPPHQRGVFMGMCSNLTSVNLAPLAAIEVLPDYFPYGCSGLKEVDLSPLVSVGSVGQDMLVRCGNLTRVALPLQWPLEWLPQNLASLVGPQL